MEQKNQIGCFTVFALNLTWGIVQTGLGFILFLFLLKKKHYRYKGSIVTEVKNKDVGLQGLSLGIFVFVRKPMTDSAAGKDDGLLQHEYGHCLQSALLGPLYLPVVGLPSLVWNKRFEAWRKKHHKAYSWFYTEAWADRWKR